MDSMALAVGALTPSQLVGGGGARAPGASSPGSYAYASFCSEPTTYMHIQGLRLCSYKHIIDTANNFMDVSCVNVHFM